MQMIINDLLFQSRRKRKSKCEWDKSKKKDFSFEISTKFIFDEKSLS